MFKKSSESIFHKLKFLDLALLEISIVILGIIFALLFPPVLIFNWIIYLSFIIVCTAPILVKACDCKGLGFKGAVNCTFNKFEIVDQICYELACVSTGILLVKVIPCLSNHPWYYYLVIWAVFFARPYKRSLKS